jgi:hypothetical protein
MRVPNQIKFLIKSELEYRGKLNELGIFWFFFYVEIGGKVFFFFFFSSGGGGGGELKSNY